MKIEMRRSLARLSYVEKLRRVAELIEFSRRLKPVKTSLFKMESRDDKHFRNAVGNKGDRSQSISPAQ